MVGPPPPGLKLQVACVQHESAATAPVLNGRKHTDAPVDLRERPPVTCLPVVRIEGITDRPIFEDDPA